MSVLNSYKVLDLTAEKGWFCGKLLADLGAEVVRVQMPGDQECPVYANTGKHSITLNIHSAPGQALFSRLATEFDIIVESFTPGWLASLGLDFEHLQMVNPRLIMVSITDFGQSGPYRNYRSAELIDSALGGQAGLSGERSGPPLKPYGTQTCNTAGLFAANGVMLALLHRQATGKGQYLDISIQECTAAALDHALVRYFYNATVAGRTGDLYWNHAFRIFPCRDGYISLSFLQHFETLVELLEAEGLAADLKEAQWRDASVRLQNIDHIIEVLATWTRHHTAEELMELGQLMHFPWAKVATMPDVVSNPQLNARGYFTAASDAAGRCYQFPGAPVKMSGSPWRVNSQIAPPGEYNAEIYQRRLRLTPSEIAKLKADGVI